MINAINNAASYVNDKCFRPTVKAINNHKVMAATVAIFGTVLGVASYKSPEVAAFLKKNVKLLTIVVPLTYTAALPFVLIGSIMMGASGSCEAHRNSNAFLEMYSTGLQKTWQAWLKYVELAK